MAALDGTAVVTNCSGADAGPSSVPSCAAFIPDDIQSDLGVTVSRFERGKARPVG